MCLLKKTLYDLKQSTKEFYLFLIKMLKEIDFKIIIIDQSIFYNDEIKIVITLRIDDLFIFDFKIDDIKSLKKQIEKRVELFDLDDIFYYLNMEISRDKKKKLS